MTRILITGLAAALLAALPIARAEDSEKAGASANLINNGGFEVSKPPKGEPEGWLFFTSKMGTGTVVTNVAAEGTSCLRIRAQGTPGAVSGVTQVLPVGQNQRFTFTAKVRQMDEDKLKGGVLGQLVIEWQDFAGKELQRTISKPWKRNLGSSSWDELEIRKVKAPQGAVQAVFGVHLNDGPNGSKGSMLVDDVVVISQ